MNRARAIRRILRAAVGIPVASGRVPARVPLLLERYRVSTAALVLPALPAPVVLVHTGGKPLRYRSAADRRSRQSLPGLVSFIPASVRAEAVLHGVGEGTLVYFDGSERLPQWLARSRFTSPATFTNDVVVALTRRLMHELDLGRDDLAYLRALGNALIAELQRELLRPTPVDATDATRGGIRIAHDASELMRARLGEPLTVADLALACGVGISSFSASFRRTTGTTPHRYLRQLRIERACELLRTTALSVAEIASAVGFRGQAHFCVAFGRDRGLTPTAYRQAARVARLA